MAKDDKKKDDNVVDAEVVDEDKDTKGDKKGKKK